MNRSAIRLKIRDYLQEASTTPASDPILNDGINEAQESLAQFVEYSFATFTISGGFVLNQPDYSWPDTLVRILAVSANDADGDLKSLGKPLSQQIMEESYASWRTDAADRPQRWWPMPNALWVHPKPNAANAGQPLEIKGTRIPPDMSSDSDIPIDLPKRFHLTLAKYVAWRWLSIDKENPTAQALARQWGAEFGADARALKEMIWGRMMLDDNAPRVYTGRPSAFGGFVDDVPGEPD